MMLRTAIVGLGWAGMCHVEAIGELGRKIRIIRVLSRLI